MSIRQINLVLYHLPVRVTDGQFRVLTYLADVADDQGNNVFPSVRRLAHLTGFHQRTVRNALSKFQALGWLHRVDQSNGVRRITYRLTLPCGKDRGNLVQSLSKSSSSGRSVEYTSGAVGSPTAERAVHDPTATDSIDSSSPTDPGEIRFVHQDPQDQERRVAPPSRLDIPPNTKPLAPLLPHDVLRGLQTAKTPADLGRSLRALAERDRMRRR